MAFGMIVLAFFCSPLYFVVRKRFIAAALNGIVYLIALMTVMMFGVGVFFWFLGTAHAMWDLAMETRERGMRRQAELIAQRMGRGDQT